MMYFCFRIIIIPKDEKMLRGNSFANNCPGIRSQKLWQCSGKGFKKIPCIFDKE